MSRHPRSTTARPSDRSTSPPSAGRRGSNTLPRARRAAAEPTPVPAETDRPSFLLGVAAKLMAEQGYHHTSMRDVARAADHSLAGLYHYFESKEDLLFRIQERVFASLLAEQRRSLAAASSREEQLALLVRNHLSFFTRHAAELKVCTFELQSLGGSAYRRIEKIRRDYYRLAAEVTGGLMSRRRRGVGPDDVRHVTLLVFGMVNWIFMWFDPARDGPVDKLGDEIVRLVLHGVYGDGARSAAPKEAATWTSASRGRRRSSPAPDAASGRRSR